MRFRPFPVKIGNTTIAGVQEQGIEDGFGDIRELSDGQVDPSAQATARHDPRAAFSTIAVATALGTVGFDGVRGALEMYDIKMGDAAEFNQTSVHVKHEFTHGLHIPVNLSAGEGERNAILSCQSFGFNPDGAAPHVVTEDVALPTAVALNTEMYGLGPVRFGTGVSAVNIEGITAVSIDFGIAVEPDHSDGSIVTKDQGITARMPVITISSRYANLQTLVKGADGKGALALTDTLNIYLRKRTATGYVANATAEHLKISIAAGEVYFAGVGGNPRVFTARIHPKRNATGFGGLAAWIDTSSAIT